MVYMGQATPETRCMVSGNIMHEYIPILIPIVLTGALIYKHRISFDNGNIRKIFGVFFIWCLLVAFKYGYGLGSNQAIGLTFFLFYAILIAYVHVNVFKKNFFDIFEHAMKWMCIFSLLLWGAYFLFPSTLTSLFHASQEVAYGNNFLYLYTWMDPAKGQLYLGIPRNAGFSWEPGRFAIIICIAICFNILRTNWSFKNITFWIFLFTLLTTFSTTGYVICVITLSLWLLLRRGLKYKIMFVLVFAFSIYSYTSLDFLGEKIEEQSDIQQMLTKADYQITEANRQDTYYASLDRFTALYFESQNVLNDPILGYTQITTNSYFSKNFSNNISLTGGFLKLFGWFGIPLGLLLYMILFRSSIKIANDYCYDGVANYMIFICLIMASVSYTIYGIPIFTTFWYYGLFSNRHEI